MINELKELENQGLITLRPNEDNTLFIANYTPKVQYDRLWTDTLLKCRGLIVNNEGKVIARSFKKFFNIEELSPEKIPNEPFKVYDKVDGSLGILYFHEGKPKIATRGSFSSDQAKKANEMLNGKYKNYLSEFQPKLTYLFEIIYPENRIVCNYGAEEKLVLLAIVYPFTGEEFSIDDFNFPDKVKEFNGINDLSKIRELEDSEKEGFVIKFQSGFRMKVKFSEYVRLHRIITKVSNKTIWEYLKEGKSVSELIERVPDEFYDWVKSVANELEEKYSSIKKICNTDYKYFRTRKEFADYAKTKQYPSLLFSMYDKKDICDQIWKIIKPQHEKPFKEEV